MFGQRPCTAQAPAKCQMGMVKRVIAVASGQAKKSYFSAHQYHHAQRERARVQKQRQTDRHTHERARAHTHAHIRAP